MKRRPRVIPVLLLRNKGLVKTIKFKDPTYIGDPINAIRIFNEKEVDEMIFLDILASKEGKQPNLDLLKDIAGECFMPLCYGGGVNNVELIREILNVGVEKVAINTQAIIQPDLISKASKAFGRSTIVVSIDVKKGLFGNYRVYINGGLEKTKYDPVELACEMEGLGAGELLINSIDNDGEMQGYDLTLISKVARSVNIPVIAAGGAGSLLHLKDAISVNASAVAAGSLFVFHGKHRAVLINYPSMTELKTVYN